jgi:hypothetical protein
MRTLRTASVKIFNRLSFCPKIRLILHSLYRRLMYPSKSAATSDLYDQHLANARPHVTLYTSSLTSGSLCHSSEQSTFDVSVIAYYLPQFYKTRYNDEWWGEGSTEWTNVAKAISQFNGQRQPRIPSHLGYYKLSLLNDIHSQVDLAKKAGLAAFCFYYYDFGNATSVLRKPLDLFSKSSEVSFPFCLCWANESWTKGFDGTSSEVLLRQSSSDITNRDFIEGALPYLASSNYLRVGEKLPLVIYRPHHISNPSATLDYWRSFVSSTLGVDLHIIAVAEPFRFPIEHYLSIGFDATTEFQPRPIFENPVFPSLVVSAYNPKFAGRVKSYPSCEQDYVNALIYSHRCHYPSVATDWDNTPRKFASPTVLIGSSPNSFYSWLSFALKTASCTDQKICFINAWNEWGEGAYLEPDTHYGLAYLSMLRRAQC